jgi:hypothetical protein
MRQLAINWIELSAAFDNFITETGYYLDTETGHIFSVTNEARRQLESIVQEHHDSDDPDAFDLEAILVEIDLHDWQKVDVLKAGFVEEHYGRHVIAIPDTLPYDAYGEMQDFIGTIEDDQLHNRLLDATQGRGAFRRFRNILRQHLAKEQHWYAFQENRSRQRILEWLEEEGIEPTNMPEPVEVDLEQLVELRYRLLDEVVIFVRAARQLPGITHISLIGSLATDKVDPKDADLLVTVTETADLSRLANLSRKLSGHTQSFDRGGEIFLADERNNYLGRICPWKQCGPGIRASCDALHCGRRLYLHDDLDEIKLPESLVAEPPLELWPEVVARVPVPDDVTDTVIRTLHSDGGLS